MHKFQIISAADSMHWVQQQRTHCHQPFISSYLRPSRSHGTITKMAWKDKIRVIDVISTDVISFLARSCYQGLKYLSIMFRFRSSDDGVRSRQQIFLFRNKNVWGLIINWTTTATGTDHCAYNNNSVAWAVIDVSVGQCLLTLLGSKRTHHQQQQQHRVCRPILRACILTVTLISCLAFVKYTGFRGSLLATRNN